MTKQKLDEEILLLLKSCYDLSNKGEFDIGDAEDIIRKGAELSEYFHDRFYYGYYN